MLELKGVWKRYGRQGPWILKDLSLELEAGAGIVIQGRSGSGKTTLLNLVAGLESPSKGAIFFHGSNITSLSNARRASTRNLHIGYCLQQPCFQKHLTVLENLILPLILKDDQIKEAKSRANAVLDALGLGSLKASRPDELSGGQLQRLSLGRALIAEPDLLLADEPTGNLDKQTAGHVLHQILEYHKSKNAMLILVSHDTIDSRYHLERFELSDGRLNSLISPDKDS